MLLFPEGVSSWCGTTHPISPVISGFLRSLKSDVVLASSRGAYLSFPRCTKDAKKGPIELHYWHLFTKDELKNASDEELYEKLMQHISYNDFRWNAEKRGRYIGKEPNAKSLETLLYLCPKCASEGQLASEGNELICKCCGNRIHVDETFAIRASRSDDYLPYSRVDEWYVAQRRKVRGDVRSNQDYSLTYPVELELLNNMNRKSMFIPQGKGTITIDRKGITYRGTRNGEEVEFLIPIIEVSGVSTPEIRYMVMYYGDETIAFDVGPENLRMMVKITAAVEELHALIDPDWDYGIIRAFEGQL